MAVTFGKREKIIVGVIIAIGAIAAVHFFAGFQQKTAELQQLESELTQKKSTLANLQSYPPPPEIKKITQNAQSLETYFWENYFNLDINKMYPFPGALEKIDQASPSETMEEEASRAEAEEEETDFAPRQDIQFTETKSAARALIAARLERLLDMREAFSQGQQWQGDSIEGVSSSALPNGRTNTMQMPFLGWPDNELRSANPNRWRIPTELPAAVRDPAALWDTINELNGLYNILDVLSRTSPDYIDTEAQYLRKLRDLGLNPQQNMQMSVVFSNWPEFRKILYTRLIWSKRAEGETINLGQGTLTYPLLLRLFRVQMPTDTELYMLYRKLEMLEEILVVARLHGVDAVTYVELLPDRAFAEYDADQVDEHITAKVQEEKKVQAATRRRGPTIGGAREEDREAPQEEPTETQTVALTGARSKTGYALVARMVINGDNDEIMHFLYNLTNMPDQYKIAGINIAPLGRAEGKVEVSFDVMKPVSVDGISTSNSGLFTENAIAPKPLQQNGNNISGQEWVSVYQSEKQRGYDKVAIIQEELERMDMPGRLFKQYTTEIDNLLKAGSNDNAQDSTNDAADNQD